jgi:hypothetical protein
MDAISQGRLVHDSMVVTAIGRPSIIGGKVNSAVQLDGDRDSLDFGDRSNDCFGNLDLCPHGVMLSLWLRPEKLQEPAYFLSSGNNGISLRYQDRKLQVESETVPKYCMYLITALISYF